MLGVKSAMEIIKIESAAGFIGNHLLQQALRHLASDASALLKNALHTGGYENE